MVQMETVETFALSRENYMNFKQNLGARPPNCAQEKVVNASLNTTLTLIFFHEREKLLFKII